jgi:hypothetical protein
MAHLSTHYEAPAVAPWEGELLQGHVARLEAVDRPRWLQVTRGRVWLTATHTTMGPHADRWLCAGDRLELPPGSDWVAEGDPGARYLLLEVPVRRRVAGGGWIGWLRALGAAFSARRRQGCTDAGPVIASAGTAR